MGVKFLLAAMAAGTALFFVVLPDAPAFQPEPGRAAIQEERWLTREAERQLIAGPRPGPLFDEVALGGPAPTKEARTKIAAFAKQHGIDITLEVEEDTLIAIRARITYGGCCGYEGADLLALRLDRPHMSECCGCEKEWIDDWAMSDTVGHLRASVRVNRVDLRWQRALSVPEVLARADALLGTSPGGIPGLREVAANHEYLLELPLPEPGRPNIWPGSDFRHRRDLGLDVRLDGGKIVEISAVLHGLAHEGLAREMTKRWGRSRTSQSGEHLLRTWKRPDRIVTLEGYPMKVLIQAR